jgi:hypothetical protein
MRGDRVRLGWRAALGTVLVTVLLLHGFDHSFVLDGYTISLLGMLLILALAGELESARLPGVDVRFRRQRLARIEREIDELPPPEVQSPGLEPDTAEADGSCVIEHVERERTERSQAELRSLARDEPTTAVAAFFVDIERAVNDLYEPLQLTPELDIDFGNRVKALTARKVIKPDEARLVMGLASLRNAYLHGSPVDQDEAVRLLAVGARLLPSLRAARTRIGLAFADLVGEIIANVPGITFERDATFEMGNGRRFRADFLIVGPIRCLVEVRTVTNRYASGPRTRDAIAQVELARRTATLDAAALVLPAVAASWLERYPPLGEVALLTVGQLEAWLERLAETSTQPAEDADDS